MQHSASGSGNGTFSVDYPFSVVADTKKVAVFIQKKKYITHTAKPLA